MHRSDHAWQCRFAPAYPLIPMPKVESRLLAMHINSESIAHRCHQVYQQQQSLRPIALCAAQNAVQPVTAVPCNHNTVSLVSGSRPLAAPVTFVLAKSSCVSAVSGARPEASPVTAVMLGQWDYRDSP